MYLVTGATGNVGAEPVVGDLNRPDTSAPSSPRRSRQTATTAASTRCPAAEDVPRTFEQWARAHADACTPASA